ncbi:MAG TPA: acetyl-CoA hydrolase/transferase C-terminal domain-containing protein [Hyphomicrobiales bacterium]|nr:acetyl-CoA hydrolase/transferase C-terminal domain-containing protein [Hyphomicrobiales bacterium]
MGPHVHRDVEECVSAVLSQVGKDIILGIPVAIGKPNHFVNALFARAVQDRSITLKIFTGLSFVKPSPKNELERRFAGPVIDRLLGRFPDLAYVDAVRRKELPQNIEVHEFFLQAGKFLNFPTAQQSYTSLNYTQVARHMLAVGVNVIAQLVSKRDEGSEVRYSLGGNTDTTLDILPEFLKRRDSGRRVAMVGQVNGALPFMEGDAEVQANVFDHILDSPAYEFPLFAPPREPVALNNYAAALHIAATIKDGGTIQLGIGAFSDALTHALILRQARNDRFADMVLALGAGRLHPMLAVETKPFVRGVYGATELFAEGYLALYRAGILKRRAFEDVDTQTRADAGLLSPEEYAKGALIHAGFFFGAKSFYDALRLFTEEDQRSFRMTAISFVNQLYGSEALKRAQRQHARFVNSAIMATLLGDVISDQLEDGRVISGVGGQNNFVTQAHELEDGRVIIELPATRMQRARLRSNIRWTYGHTTIPRHLRDIIVTEYGAADLRGLSDRDAIAAMLNIADSRFQQSLLKKAKAAGKIKRQYEIPATFRENTPERIEEVLGPARKEGLLPIFPLGADFTEEELALLPAMMRVKDAQSSPLTLLRLLLAGKLWSSSSEQERILLRRLDLEKPRSFRERLYAAVMRGALRLA